MSPVFRLGGYKFSCTTSASCDGARNFSCDTNISRCICAPHPDPDYMFIFDVHVHACVPILVQHKNEFWSCEDAFYSWNSTQPQNSLEFCKSHHECHVAHNSKSLRCNFSTCSCECLAEHPETGLRLVTQNVNTTRCDYHPIGCQNETDCGREYGRHATCNPNTTTCECEPRAQFSHGKCIQKRVYHETCASDLECELGLGKNVRCDRTKPVKSCECVDGFTLDVVAGLCTRRKVNIVSSDREHHDQEKDAHQCSKTLLIILAVFCCACLTTLFVVVWCQKNKSKYRFKAMERDPTSVSFTSTTHVLNEKTYNSQMTQE